MKSLNFALPVQTRHGREVVILIPDAGGDFPVVGQIPSVDAPGDLHRWTLDGRHSGPFRRIFNLVQVGPPPLKAEKYMVLVKRPDGTVFVAMYGDKRQKPPKFGQPFGPSGHQIVGYKVCEIEEGEGFYV